MLGGGLFAACLPEPTRRRGRRRIGASWVALVDDGLTEEVTATRPHRRVILAVDVGCPVFGLGLLDDLSSGSGCHDKPLDPIHVCCRVAHALAPTRDITLRRVVGKVQLHGLVGVTVDYLDVSRASGEGLEHGPYR